MLAEDPAASNSSPASSHLATYMPKAWISKCHFAVIDAAKGIHAYKDDHGKDISHIYSYNKVMSHKDRQGICQILNRTQFKVLAWYQSPEESRKAGLTDVQFVMRIPMQSTGNEKFSVFIFIKDQPKPKRK